jgi:tripartite-type tricarboxylate transporter receptor subunit TctC
MIKRIAAIVLAGLAILGPAMAQSYPNRPIKMILPFPPGGPIDTMGRLIAQRMSAGLGQNVIIENRAGGGSSIGMRAVASADPDGYTLLFASSGPLAITPALYKNLDYDPNTSFVPIATVSSARWRWWCRRACRSSPCRSSLPTPRPIPASSTMAAPSARPRTWPGDCSRC